MRALALLLCLALPLGWALSCAGTGNEGDTPDGAMAPDGGDGGAPPVCFTGTPRTEPELLNRCTDAERIERPGRVPPEVWNGMGPLPEAPL